MVSCTRLNTSRRLAGLVIFHKAAFRQVRTSKAIELWFAVRATPIAVPIAFACFILAGSA